MIRRPPRCKRTVTLLPLTALFRSYRNPMPAPRSPPRPPSRHDPRVLAGRCGRARDVGELRRPARQSAARTHTGPRAATRAQQIGRAHVCTPVTNAQLVCRLLLEKKKKKHIYLTINESEHKLK